MHAPLVPFGHPMRESHFMFSPYYLPVNHGAFGTYPKSVREANEKLRAECEEAPDTHILYEGPRKFDKSRELVAEMLNASPNEIVLVPNASTGIDTVLKNFVWEKGDVILCYGIVYGAVANGVTWLVETGGVEIETVKLDWPMSDDEVVGICGEAIRRINQEGKGQRRVRLAICDTIVSMPGIRIPYERLVNEFQREGALVLVDGAHGIGHIDIDLGKVQPDFFVTNLHKWLFVPRGCAALYVPMRHQHMIRTSLPTSWGFIGRSSLALRSTSVPNNGESPFVGLFRDTGTLDRTNFMTVEAAIKFRQEVCGGEQAIRDYCNSTIRSAGDKIAELFGSEVLDHPDSQMRDCHFSNIRLPLEIGDEPGQVKADTASYVALWLKIRSAEDCGSYFQTLLYKDAWWWRISGQIYLEESDFIKAANMMLGLCERIKRGEHVPKTA